MIGVIEFPNAWFRSLRFNSRRLEEKNGQGSRGHLLPSSQKLSVGVCGRHIAAQEETKMTHAIVSVA